MNFSSILLIIISIGMADGLLFYDSMVFAEVGNSATLSSTIKESRSRSALTWYRQTHRGNITVLGHFSSYHTKSGRFTVSMPNQLGNFNFTINNVKTEDSGRYLTTLQDGPLVSSGPAHYLVVTDPRSPPILRMFEAHQDRWAFFLCELNGGDRSWTGPVWTVSGDTETGERIDEHGIYIRWSSIRLSDAGDSSTISCTSHNTNDNRTIKQDRTVRSNGLSTCERWLLFAGHLSVMLLFLTVICSVLWVRRMNRRKQNRPV